MTAEIEKRPLPFDGAEYAARIAKVRVAMDRAGLDALIISDPSNMAWLTGYDGYSFYVHQAVILTLSGAPMWWGRPMDAQGARFTAWMSDQALFSYPDSYVQNPDHHPYEHLCGLLKSWGLSSARIGVELDNYYFSAACIGQLLSHNGKAEYLDATGLVNWQRLVKSEAEIRLIRRAGKIVQSAHEMIRDTIEVGKVKSELIADIYGWLIEGSEDEEGSFGGDYPAIAPMAPSGMEATAAHLTWDDRPFQEGEATFFEIAGCYRRYHCPQSRTVFLGEPTAEIRKAEQVALEGIDAALKTVKPGVEAQEVVAAWDAVLKKHGIQKESRIGYSIGLSYPPDWGERTLSLRAGDTTVLEPNMTIHMIPALWQDTFGLEITETFLVTESGCECICDTARELFVKK